MEEKAQSKNKLYLYYITDSENIIVIEVRIKNIPIKAK